VANLVSALRGDFDFRIVTSDRDLGDREAYAGIVADQWQEVGEAKVFYLSPGLGKWARIAKLVRAADFDLIYLNSFFSRPFSMFPLLVWAIGCRRAVPMLLAPRGEFSPGALSLKPRRKQFYIDLIKGLRLEERISLHLSTDREKEDVSRWLSDASTFSIAGALPETNMYIAPDLLGEGPIAGSAALQRPRKVPGALKVAFVSRISRMKNLDTALGLLAKAQGMVHFDIYGPAEDRQYWSECQGLIQGLPPNVKAEYRGELPHHQVAGVLADYHLFLLPTRGENFGHVIIEALAAGCPVLISDRTPWRSLKEKGVGWDLPLEDLSAFRQAIQECVEMDQGAFEIISQQATRCAFSVRMDSRTLEQNRSMFSGLLSGARSRARGKSENP